MCQDLDALDTCAKRRRTLRYVEHWRKCPERKRLVEIAGENRSSWVLVTVEQRFYTKLYLLRLVRVGAAVFADVGRAWFEDDDRPGNRGVLRDVGLGLRLVSHKASSPTVHVDIAFPLDRDPSISAVQWPISSKETF